MKYHCPKVFLLNISRIAMAVALCLVAAVGVQAQQRPDDLRLVYTEPAGPWETALPVGSGRLGAMVFGRVPDERIQFNEDTLWTGQPHDYVRKGASDHLEQIRELVRQDKADEIKNILPKVFLSDPIRQKAYQPFGDVRITFAHQPEYDRYERQLDLTTAIASTSYRVGKVNYQGEVFASYPDQVIVAHYRADKPGELGFVVTMDSPHNGFKTEVVGSDTLVMNGQVEQGGLRFESRLQVRVDGGKIVQREGALSIEGANSATLVLAAATSFKNFRDISADPSARAKAYLDKVAGKTYDKLRATHIADFQPLFNRVKFDLGRSYLADLPTNQRLALINVANHTAEQAARQQKNSNVRAEQALVYDPSFAVLYFQMGRYMLITASRPGSQPANLQGVWNELLDPPWESKYTTNINVEMNYWPAEVTNLSECHLPLFDMIDDLRISGAETARGQYNAGGWVLHHNTDLWRGAAPINNVDGLWPTGGAWLCHHLWDHYLYTGDMTFLRDKAYPAMKGACEFFIDFLVRDPETGWLVTFPSHSPEQAPPNHGTLTWGPTMDNQLIRSLFSYTSEAASILGVDADFAARLDQMRKQLPPNQIGQHGQLQEWIKDWDMPNNAHRHMSPLWGLYPGWDITPEDSKVFDAAKVLLKWRGDGSTGWSFGWRIALWAREFDGDAAMRQLCLQLSRRTFPNLFDKGGPYQADGNYGATGGIAELLLQSHRRVPGTRTPIIHLLPALPEIWRNGSITGLRARGGFEIDLHWADGQLASAIVRSSLGGDCQVRCGGHAVDLKTQPGQTITLDGQLKVIQ